MIGLDIRLFVNLFLVNWIGFQLNEQGEQQLAHIHQIWQVTAGHENEQNSFQRRHFLTDIRPTLDHY